jgi:hypothetical protein
LRKSNFSKKHTILILVTALVVLLLFFIAFDKPKLLCRYYKIVKSKNIKDSLSAELPLTEKWDVSVSDRKFSLGYAEIAHPFGEITSISKHGLGPIVINSLQAEVFIRLPLDTGENEVIFYEWPRDKVIYLDMDPYSFAKQMVESKPKPFIEILKMRTHDLYIYLHMLEQKAILLGNCQLVKLFETPSLRGFIFSGSKSMIYCAEPREPYIEQNPNRIIIVAWDNNDLSNRIYIDCKTEQLQFEDIQKLITSFTFTLDPLPQEDSLHSIVKDVIEKHPAFAK